MTTPANPADLITWLRACYDERERLAREGTPFGSGRWIADAQYGDRAQVRDRDGGCVIHDDGELSLATAEHIALNDPADVLADLDAKRRILDLHAIEVKVVDAPAFNPVTGERISDECDVTCAVCGWVSSDPASACPTVRLLALPFAARDGYRSEWAPA